MLALFFQAGGQRYAFDARELAEVAPDAQLRPLPGAPAPVAGLLHYRRTLVPVVDLSQLFAGRASRRLFSTRILLVPFPGAGAGRLLGLRGEGVTEAARVEARKPDPSGVAESGDARLGAAGMDVKGPFRFVRVAALLPTALCELLLAASAGEARSGS